MVFQMCFQLVGEKSQISTILILDTQTQLLNDDSACHTIYVTCNVFRSKC